ncbi:hypothetical protein [Crateriforma conspicua]|uniref:hypothetical protein n=1 Tax=Crateriforma conspicua TaxID=2527996 RepID=UPI0011A522A6|nr:hypothetical protein [Crateriforma conspicua]
MANNFGNSREEGKVRAELIISGEVDIHGFGIGMKVEGRSRKTQPGQNGESTGAELLERELKKMERERRFGA